MKSLYAAATHTHTHTHTAVFLLREDTFFRPLWTLTTGETGGGVWWNQKPPWKSSLGSDVWRKLPAGS